ncbi:hypothetical protein KUCAC02_030718, partial [Chaenocephalus aceratus]
ISPHQLHDAPPAFCQPQRPSPGLLSTTALTNGNHHHSPPTLNAVPSPPQRYSKRTVLFIFLLAGQPAAAGHLRGSPAEQAETLPDNAAGSLATTSLLRLETVSAAWFLALVNSTVTIEEFHSQASGGYHFPLRPFVIPFLKDKMQ